MPKRSEYEFPSSLSARAVRLVQEEGVRELAEADEQRGDPGEQHEGLLVAAAQAPEEGQHRPVVVQQQETRVRAAGGVQKHVVTFNTSQRTGPGLGASRSR